MDKLFSRRLLIVVVLVLVAAVAEFLDLPLSEPTLSLIEALGIAGIAGFATEDAVKAWRAGTGLGEAAQVLRVAAEEAEAVIES